MTIGNAIQHTASQLQDIYDEREAHNITLWVLEVLTGLPQLLLKAHAAQELDPEQQARLDQYVRELRAHRPVQYVLGESYFMDFKVYVDEQVLIPRPETEELADWIIRYCRNSGLQQPGALDIGTGSGCIALALKKHLPGAVVTALDIAPGALEVAARNARALDLDLDLLQMNILDEASWGKLPRFDIIVSNPPYITLPEKETILPNVLDYEPHQALFVTDNDPQQFYKAIERLSRQHLAPGGTVFMELHRDFARDTQAYYEQKGWHTKLRQDMQGNDRMLAASLI